MVLEAIRYQYGKLSILDQLELPHAKSWIDINTCKEAWHAIHEMRTRGAPAIAIVAALSLAANLQWFPPLDENVTEFITARLDYLVTSRPTAVNLADAARKLKSLIKENESLSEDEIKRVYIQAAEKMLADDVQDNKNIGRHGADYICNTSKGKYGPVSVLTHCNTGSLATAGYGTALGVIRKLHENGNLRHAFCTETRPYNQGSRLTAFELVDDQIPATLITDSMAGALLHLRAAPGHDNIAAIVTGADRVAANGDTANKIGTYALAVLARHHGIKFLIAAPRTTIDLDTKTGADIVIEERPKVEVTTLKGTKLESGALTSTAETISIAAEGIDVWNPAFDVTPAELIDGIISEVGVAEKGPNGKFDLKKLFAKE